MKVIFLDIDGVLNVMHRERDEFGAIFHQNFVDNLETVINETGAKIIISSSWRHGGLQRMIDMWKFRELPGEVIGITPDLWGEVKGEDFYEKLQRGHEIQSVLDRTPEITSYVIFDDDDDMLPSQKGNFVMCSNNINHPDCIDIGYGLTKECAKMAIRILNR
jgi:hypothetical protein